MDDRSALPLVYIAVTVYDTIIARCYVILGTGASASASKPHGWGNSTLRYNNNMTGFSALPTADEAASEGSAQWAGVAKVLGPPWARFPTITVGLVGVQVMWSIEMAYGEQSGKRYPTRTLL
jgi:hypothetical protein